MQAEPKSLLIGLTRAILCRTNTGNKTTYTFIEGITEDQEANIDRLIKRDIRVSFRTKNGDIIDQNDIHTYGPIDLEDPHDIASIDNMDLVDSEGSKIYSGFDYKTGDIYPIDGKIRWHITFDALTNFMQAYCKINKPERIIIYNKTLVHKNVRRGIGVS